uniref:Uncharacterized protein n=1 Tax=Rhizophora mucronata TaxID=61149 RepID=A0A2P2R1K9_RHIMU
MVVFKACLLFSVLLWLLALNVRHSY